MRNQLNYQRMRFSISYFATTSCMCISFRKDLRTIAVWIIGHWNYCFQFQLPPPISVCIAFVCSFDKWRMCLNLVDMCTLFVSLFDFNVHVGNLQRGYSWFAVSRSSRIIWDLPRGSDPNWDHNQGTDVWLIKFGRQRAYMFFFCSSYIGVPFYIYSPKQAVHGSFVGRGILVTHMLFPSPFVRCLSNRYEWSGYQLYEYG